MANMKVLLLTNEYPPHMYGGAGVHVDYLSRHLSSLVDVEVRCFGDQRLDEGSLKAWGFDADKSAYTCPSHLQGVFAAMQRCLDFNSRNVDADVVHCHTWYTNFGAVLARLNYGIPMVLTTHSLEPLRPWKREQLKGGYDFSLWVERVAIEMADAVVAVSRGTREDILNHFLVQPERVKIIHNGIDPDEYRKTDSQGALERFGVSRDRPFLLFVGRITRQKGIVHLVNAIRYMDKDFQVVLCAGAPDTPEIAAEMKAAVESVSRDRKGVIWIEQIVDKPSLIELYSHAAVFCCPSIYEPFGIINLEAMACETPVVASAVGGIPEVVLDGVTGYLVPLERTPDSPFEPANPEKFARDLAEPINRLMGDAALREQMGKAGRQRAEEHFSWKAIAQKTVALYESLVRK